MTNMFKIGEKVFAKLKYYPHWPGIVDNIVKDDSTGKATKYLVKCFGSNDYVAVKPSDIFPYDDNKSIYGQLKADNYRNKKINAALMEAAETDKCQIEDCIEVTEVKKRIDNFESIDDLDLETSLTLAAEAGNALLTENSKLKEEIEKLQSENSKLLRELHNRWSDMQTYLEIEEASKQKDIIIEELTEKNNELLQESCYNSKRAEQERSLKEEFIKQAELENKNLITENNKLKHKLTETSKLTHQIEIDMKIKIDAFLENEKKLKEEVSNKNKTILDMQKRSENLILKLTELEKITRTYISSFLINIKDYSDTIDTNNSQPNPHTTNSPVHLNHPTTSLEDESVDASKNLITSGETQTCNKKLANTKNFYSVSLQVAKALKQPDAKEGAPKIMLNKKPPQHAKMRSKEESLEDFFLKHNGFYKECIIKTAAQYSKNSCNASKKVQPLTVIDVPENQQSNQHFLGQTKQKKTKFKPRLYLNSSLKQTQKNK